MKEYFEPKTMKIYNFDFSVHKIINFSHILPDYKTVYMVTPQFSLSFRNGMPHTTKYSKSRKMAHYKINHISFLV